MTSTPLLEASASTRSEANIRAARRYEALATEMETVFRKFPMPSQDQFVLSLYVALLHSHAEKMRRGLTVIKGRGR